MNHSHQKILVIHPSDPSTDVLCQIYRDINATVIRQKIPKSQLKKLMKEADRIIILGHGTKDGMGFVEYKQNIPLYITKLIDSTLVYLLREKKDNVYIWCHADKFVKKYKLSGFSTGMFISETIEAEYYNIDATEDEIDISNEKFAKLLRINIHKDGETLRNIIKEEYVLDSNVARYNHQRIYNF